MSHHLNNKSTSHVPLSTSNRPLDNQSTFAGSSGARELPSHLGSAPLHQTYHHEEDFKGPRPHTIAHEKQDRFEGGNLNTHESVLKKETVIQQKPEKFQLRTAPLVQPVIQPVSVPLPVAQPVPIVQSTRTIIEPTLQRSVVEKATIVKETLLPEEKIEIQPVIHREREQTEVHKVVQPLHERDVLATKVVQATLADQVRAPIIESDAAFQARSREADTRFASTKEYAALKSQTVQKSAIVEEHIRKTIIEEVQPVLYKETVVPVIIQETQPIYERIVEAPVIVTEERAMRDLGTQFTSTSLNDQRAFQNMGQGVIPPQSFVETTNNKIIREELPFSGQQSSSQQFGGLPNQQWNQNQQLGGQQFAGSQLPNQMGTQQWNQQSSLKIDPNQKLYQQNPSLQKNPLQPNVSNTRPF